MSTVINHPTADWKPDWQVQAQNALSVSLLEITGDALAFQLTTPPDELEALGLEVSRLVRLATHPDYHPKLTPEVIADIWTSAHIMASLQHPETRERAKRAADVAYDSIMPT